MKRSINILLLLTTLILNSSFGQEKVEFKFKVKSGKYGDDIILKLVNGYKHHLIVTPASGIEFGPTENDSFYIKNEYKGNEIYDWAARQYRNNIDMDSLIKSGKIFQRSHGHRIDTASSYLLLPKGKIVYYFRNNSNEIKRVAIRVFDPKSNTGSKIVFKLYPTQQIRFFKRVTHIEVDNVQSIMSFL